MSLAIFILALSMTHPMPIRRGPVDPLRLDPGAQIPESPDSFSWKITPQGKDVPSAPVYGFNDKQKLIFAGSIASGSEIKLEEFIIFGSRIYYAVPKALLSKIQDSGTRFDKFWVRGFDIKPNALKPAAK